MKRVTLILATIFLSLTLSAADPSAVLRTGKTGKHLFILSGQSNMNGLNPKFSFTPAVEKAFGKSSVIIVKDAQNGQSIRRWYKQWKPANGTKLKHFRPNQIGDLYDRLMKKVKAATENQTIASVTFIWMQGESDAGAQSAVYEASFNGLIDQIKKDLVIDRLNLVIGRISDYGVVKKNKNWEKIREIQVKLADSAPSGAWVDTDDLNNKSRGDKTWDDLHYTKEGYKILGQRFAENAIELIKKTKKDR